MNKKTIGIDIGSAFLKAVCLRSDFKGRLSIATSALIDMDAAGGLEQSFRKLFADTRFKDGQCIISIPARSCSFRNLSLPFLEEKTVHEIITYELEPHIPDPIETVVVSHLPPHSTAESTTVLAAAARKQDLHDLTQYAAGSSIAMIDTDAVPIALNILETDSPDSSWILLDIGARASVVVFVQKKSIVHVRSFPWGMEDFPDAGRNLPNSVRKEERESILNQKAEDLQNSKRMVRNRLQCFQEIADTLQFLAAKDLLDDDPWSRIYLTGGGALSAPLRKDLEAVFKLPVVVVDLLKMRGISLQAKDSLSWNAPLMNQALALALRGSNGSQGFNFKEDEIVSTKKPRGLKSHLLWTATMLAIVLFCLGINLTVRYDADSRKLETIKAEIAKTFKDSCPEITRIVDPVRQLQQKISETKNDTGGIENGTPFVEHWKKAMDTFPENSGILITELNYNQQSLEFSGEVSDYQTINRWKSDLEEAKSFSDVQMQFGSGTKTDAKKTFRLRITHGL